MRVLSVLFFSLLSLIVACTSTSLATPKLSDSDRLCNNWSLSDVDAFCFQLNENALLIQSNSEQVTASLYQIALVIDGTAYIEDEDSISVVALEGRVFIGAQGQNRILSAGNEVNVPIIDAVAQFPSGISDISSSFSLNNDLLNSLPRSIDIDTLIPTLTPRPTAIPVINRNVCTVLDTWRGQYVVEAGDTLNAIANRFNLTVTELSEGNCLDNVSQINVGQIFNVPVDENSVNQNQVVGFWADNYTIDGGSCTILRWDATNVMSIFLDETPVAEDNSQEVCPQETQTYTLSVTYPNGEDVERQITISVPE